MNEIEAFRNRIFSLKDEAYDKDVILPFYNLENQILIKRCFKNNDYVKAYFYGGYLDAEYKRVILSVNEPKLEDYQITIYKIIFYDKDIEVNHRMLLGSILSLGLKREIVGDIVFDGNYYYFFLCSSMTNFVKENLNKIGKYNISLELYDKEVNVKKEYEEKEIFIASMRLDNVLANSYNLGRARAQEMINDGLVKVNHEVVLKGAKILKESDLLSVKGKGRVILENIKGKTKSGNLVLKIKIPK